MWVILAVVPGIDMTEINGEYTNIIWPQVGIGGGAFTAIAIEQ